MATTASDVTVVALAESMVVSRAPRPTMSPVAPPASREIPPAVGFRVTSPAPVMLAPALLTTSDVVVFVRVTVSPSARMLPPFVDRATRSPEGSSSTSPDGVVRVAPPALGSTREPNPLVDCTFTTAPSVTELPLADMLRCSHEMSSSEVATMLAELPVIFTNPLDVTAVTLAELRVLSTPPDVTTLPEVACATKSPATAVSCMDLAEDTSTFPVDSRFIFVPELEEESIVLSAVVVELPTAVTTWWRPAVRETSWTVSARREEDDIVVSPTLITRHLSSERMVVTFADVMVASRVANVLVFAAVVTESPVDSISMFLAERATIAPAVVMSKFAAALFTIALPAPLDTVASPVVARREASV